MGLEAGRCCGLFINDVNILGNVDDSYLYKSGDMGEGGVKKSGKIGDIIYGRPLNVVLFCIIHILREHYVYI